MFCRECGTKNEDDAKFCRNCGLPIVPIEETVADGQPGAAQQAGPQTGMPYGQPGPQAAYAAQGNMTKPTSASAVLSLIFGIISVVFCFTIVFSIGFGIAAIILSVTDRKKNGSSGLTIAGLVLGIIGISLALLIVIWFFASGEFSRLIAAARNGTLQDYLEHLGGSHYHVYGF